MVSFIVIKKKKIIKKFLDVRLTKFEDKLHIFSACLGNTSERMDYLEQRLEDNEFEREDWLERNVAAEGEVTVLRERVDLQEMQIQKLVDRLDAASKLIKLLRPSAPAGEYIYVSYTGY